MTLAVLRAKHDALLVATGVYKARDIKAPGVGAEGVVPALDYLIASNRRGFGHAVPAFESGALHADGTHLVFLGGGHPPMSFVPTPVLPCAASFLCLFPPSPPPLSPPS